MTAAAAWWTGACVMLREAGVRAWVGDTAAANWGLDILVAMQRAGHTGEEGQTGARASDVGHDGQVPLVNAALADHGSSEGLDRDSPGCPAARWTSPRGPYATREGAIIHYHASLGVPARGQE